MTTDTKSRQTIRIADHRIGPDEKPFVIAEMSANHNGDFAKAVAILEAAKRAGADAVKLQTYTADTMTIDCEKDEFRIDKGLWAGRYLYELYQQASTPWEWHRDLFEKARELGITVFSTPFDETAVDLLEELNAPAYKIASFELTDLPLIQKAAATGKPMIMSTGMANWDEIEEAVTTARAAGAEELVVLHCVSGYPTPPEDSNLRTIPVLAERLGVPVGLSDHTLGTTVATAAVALGACVIEKHFTLDRTDEGPDAAFSLEPDELAELCETTRTAHAALGQPRSGRMSSEDVMSTFRRSIYAVTDIEPGEPLSRENVRVIRPGYGLKPRYFKEVLGRKASQRIERGTALSWELID